MPKNDTDIEAVLQALDRLSVETLNDRFSFRDLQRAWQQRTGTFVRSRRNLSKAIGQKNGTSRSVSRSGSRSRSRPRSRSRSVTRRSTSRTPRRGASVTRRSPRTSSVERVTSQPPVAAASSRRRSHSLERRASSRTPSRASSVERVASRSSSQTRERRASSRTRRPAVPAAAAPSGSPHVRRSSRSGLDFPAHLAESTTPLVRPRQAEESLEQRTQCFDFVMYADENANTYIQDDPDENIILVGPSSVDQPTGTGPVCFTRTRLRQLTTSPSDTFYPCKSFDDTIYIPNPSLKLTKIPLAHMTVVVPAMDALAAANNHKAHIFQVEAANYVLPRTASNQFIRAMDRVSSDHCQLHTDKAVYRLRPVQFQ